jgi:hypothetical protein
VTGAIGAKAKASAECVCVELFHAHDIHLRIVMASPGVFVYDPVEPFMEPPECKPLA